MADAIRLTYEISPDDFTRAGEASSDVKSKLKRLGVPPEAIRKVSIAMYEGEINMVIHADGGRITVEITPEKILMILLVGGVNEQELLAFPKGALLVRCAKKLHLLHDEKPTKEKEKNHTGSA